MTDAPTRRHRVLATSLLERSTMPTTKPATFDSPAIASAASLVGRLMISAIFLISGIWKITAPTATIADIASAGFPFPQLGLLIAIAVELVLAPALVLGYRSRWVAAVMAAFCVATAVFFHGDFADRNMFLHFLKNIAMAGGLLQIVAFGAGRFSLDAGLGHPGEPERWRASAAR
jgi:putative oxidoreductase